MEIGITNKLQLLVMWMEIAVIVVIEFDSEMILIIRKNDLE
jgi:hypothetical protein